MLKVLLVENETLDRLQLKTLIDWPACGYQLVGEAQNGSEGLDLIASLEPDIVITDVRMPVLNGLELMSACPRGPRRPEFLIMSGFDDYDLVRRGLTLGAYDYLRKFDVDARTLLEALGGIRARIASRASEDRPPTPEREGASAPLLGLLGPLLKGQPCDSDELQGALAQGGVTLLPHAVRCALIRVDDPEGREDPTSSWSPTERSVLGIADEILRPSYRAVCVPVRPGLFVVFASPLEPSEPFEAFESTLERLVDMLSIYLNLEARAGLGSSGKDAPGIQQAYQRAQTALRNRFFFEGRRVVSWNQVPAELDPAGRSGFLANKDGLRRALETQKREALASFFDGFLEDLGRREWSASAVKEALIELNYLVREYFEGNQLDPARYLARSRMTYEDIAAMEDVGEARRWVRALAEELGEFLSGEARVEYSRVVLNTKKFVAEHFAQDLTLGAAALQACLSPNYFSSIFKKHAGVSFTEYLNSVRIAAAQRLLTDTDLLIYEVAERCGYHDTYYFNRLFKRLTGISPGSYRRQAGRTGEKDKESGD